MEETIDLREYFTIIKKRFWIVILTTVIAVGISVVITNCIKVQFYQAQTTMIVNVEKNENQAMLTSDQISAGQKLAVLYGEIIKISTRASHRKIKSRYDTTAISRNDKRISG